MRTAGVLVAAAFALVACGSEREPVEPGWTRLDNGLRVCVRRIESANDVAVLTQFAVGSDHDPVGQSGLAHLAEHLYVTSAAGEVAARTAEHWSNEYGGRCHAFTTPRYTRVSVVVAPDRIDAVLADAAARMSNLRIEPDDLERERASVLLQMAERVTECEPDAEAARIALNRASPPPHGQVDAGVEDHVAKLTLADVRDGAGRFYRPANTRLVVTGNVDAARVMTLVEKHFASLDPGDRMPRPEIPPPRAGDFTIDSDAPLVPGTERMRAVCIAYATPSPREPEYIANLLFTLRSFTPMFEFMPDAGFRDAVAFRWTRDKDRTPADVARAMDLMVERFRTDEITDAERETLRVMVRRIDDLHPDVLESNRAAQLAADLTQVAESGFDSARLLKDVDRLSRDDLAGYAAKWLRPDQRVVVTVHGVATIKPPRPVKARDAAAPSHVAPIPGTRVVLTWDVAGQHVVRKFGDREIADDEELQKAIAADHANWVKEGKPDAPVMIESDPRIPWKDVVNVVNIIKSCGIDKIEFALGAPPTSNSK